MCNPAFKFDSRLASHRVVESTSLSASMLLKAEHVIPILIASSKGCKSLTSETIREVARALKIIAFTYQGYTEAHLQRHNQQINQRRSTSLQPKSARYQLTIFSQFIDSSPHSKSRNL